MANKINQSAFFHNILNDDKYSNIEQMVNTFKKSKNQELEVSFRNVNYSNYMRIIEHYIDMVPEDKITSTDSLDISIMLTDGNTYRVSLFDKDLVENFIKKYTKVGSADIQKYLLSINPTDDIEIMLKNRGTADRIFIEDLNLVFKITDETILTKDSQKPAITGTEKMLYRYKQRVSLAINSDVRIDITEVKESNNLWNLGNRHGHYEIEIEVINHKIDLDKFWNEIYSAMVIVQDSDVPVSKSEALSVINEYQQLLGLKNVTHLDSRNVISIENHHIVNFIPNKYAVTDKADGERYFLFSLPTGVYLLSMNLTVKKIDLGITDALYQYMILDGELVKNESGHMFLAFDVVYANQIDYRYNDNYVLTNRLDVLNSIIDKCFGNLIKFTDYTNDHPDLELAKIKEYDIKELKQYWKQFTKNLEKSVKANKLFITRKLYFVPYGIESCEVFMYADMIWKLYVYDELTPYKLDGIIYTPINAPYIIRVSQDNLDSVPLEYKWKKPLQNSIDFYVKFEKDANGNEAIFYDNAVRNGTGNAYKICTLYVGINKGSQEKPIPFKVNGIEQQSNIYLIDGEARDAESKVIDDGTVVEFIFDNSKTDIDDAYKWIPLKTRYDKTESVIKYQKRYGNNLHIATRIWRTIVNPITEENIATLANVNSFQKEIDRLSKANDIYEKKNFTYYQKKTGDATNMRAFNNWIKTNMIQTYCKNKQNVLDIGCGRGGDLIKFVHATIDQYVGIDIDNNGLYIINDSAYNRYKNLKKSIKNIIPMYFINADARGLFNVRAQESIIANMSDANKKLIQTYLSGNTKYNVINCQFSIHYYLSDEISWSNFCKNINNHLEDNGYFLITCFDGQLIYDKLLGKQKMTTSYTDDKGKKNIFFEINKIYNDNEKTDIGMAIDIYNSLISNPGVYIREYLVFSDFLEKSLRENCGLELVETDSFFNLFNLYKNYFTQENGIDFMNEDSSKKRYDEIRDFYLMINPSTQKLFTAEQVDACLASFKLSMLNRYYVFKKKTTIDTSEPSRIIGINHKINVDKVLTPYFDENKIIIDPTKRTSKINKIYHAIRKKYTNIKPDVYLIRHNILEEELDNEVYRRNKLEFAKIKEGADPNILLIYKSPEKYFYPIYYDGISRKKYLLNSEKIVNDLDILVALTDKLHHK